MDRYKDCCSEQFPIPEAGLEGLYLRALSRKKRRNSKEVTD